uniref:NADH dehydrogenase [ubiquinone] 1 beta subcomplex subunit 10 n=1 Tax=Graphocephala atropunctata TaxID=36148 RepID=A0A1B6M7K7_9HEMI
MVAESDDNAPVFIRACHSVYNFFEAPVVWFRKSVVEPNRKEYYWYHQKFRRVPTVDQCYDDDPVCKWEALQQFHRDNLVDSAILQILRQRFEHCMLYETPNKEKCLPLHETYEQSAADWFSKYGDLGWKLDAEKAYYKQKHRMIWERRHGKIGSGTVDNRPPGVNVEETSENSE